MLTTREIVLPAFSSDDNWLRLCAMALGFLLLLLRLLIKLAAVLYDWYANPLWTFPGPPRSNWLFGTVLEMYSRSFLEVQKEWIAAEGGLEKVDMIHHTETFGAHTLLLLRAEYIQKVMLSQQAPTPRYDKRIMMLSSLAGKGLVFLMGNEWQRHRRLLHPSFQGNFLMDILSSALSERVPRFLKAWERLGQNGIELELQSQFSLITLDIIGRCGFQHEFGGMEALEKWVEMRLQSSKDPEYIQEEETPRVRDKLLNSIQKAFQVSPRRIFLGITGLYRFNRIFDPAMYGVTFNANEAADAIVEEAKQKASQKRSSSSGKSQQHSEESSTGKYTAKSILELLLDATNADKGLAHDELRDEIKTFLVAGHETTSNWLHWAIYALTKYPDIQERLYREVCAAAGDNGDGSDLTMKKLSEMTYLDAFMQEVLRYHPPVGMLFRKTRREEVFGKRRVPKGTTLTLPMQLMHRHPLYWKDAETFRPDRWIKSPENPNPGPSEKYAFFPFSLGPRNCIGYRFATIETKWILAAIIRRFHIQPAPSLEGVEHTLHMFITVKAKPGLKAIARPRS